MELLLSAKLAHPKFHGIPWNSMELLMSAKLAHPSSMEFHGIPWNCSCQRNWRTRSSMEFHGIPCNCVSSEIGAFLVPWNSMEFHGTLCQRNWRTPSSMEFHGTARVIEIGEFQVPMEFHGTARVSEIGAPKVPWNSMELLMSAKLAHFKFHEFHGTAGVSEIGALRSSMEFHGIPWNCSCQRNWRTQSSMEFHGIPWNSRVIEIGTPSSMEFHGIPCEIGAFSSLEFLLMSAKLAHSKFHGIPWNCSCRRNWRTPRIPNSMELLVRNWRSSLEVPWNSMELLVSAKLATL